MHQGFTHAARVALTAFCAVTGCAAPGTLSSPVPMAYVEYDDRAHSLVQQVSAETPLDIAATQEVLQPVENIDRVAPVGLADLEATARAQNPTLLRQSRHVAAARAKARYIAKLPDPTVATNIFAHPIETAAGSQRANVTLMQMLPWLKRLDAQAQQAWLDALALEQEQLATELEVVAGVHIAWARLYVLDRQLETVAANQEQLQQLINIVNGRVQTGAATQDDLTRATLDFARLEEQKYRLQRQAASTSAELNRLLGRPADHLVPSPASVAADLPDVDLEHLRHSVSTHNPSVIAAEVKAQAASWGIEVARLHRRPDISLNAAWFAMDDNRPASPVVDIGRDAWAVGAQVSVPLWHDKYDAMRAEAEWKHFAAHASVDELRQQYDARLIDLWERAIAADSTASLYRETILPQAHATLRADQQAYGNNAVDFEQVLRDLRAVLTMELGYHQAIGDLSAALARIQQVTAVDFETTGAPLR